MKKDMIYTLADYIIDTDSENLPKEVVERAKILIVDTLGVAMPGHGAPGVEQVETFIKDLYGKPESSIFI